MKLSEVKQGGVFLIGTARYIKTNQSTADGNRAFAVGTKFGDVQTFPLDLEVIAYEPPRLVS